MATVASRLNQIMRMRNLRQKDIIDLAKPFCQQPGIKITKSDMSQFVNGKSTPGQWKLAILARALDVSEAWLMGFDVPMERPNSAPQLQAAAERNALIRDFQSLSRENQQRVIDYVKVLLLAQQHGPDSPE